MAWADIIAEARAAVHEEFALPATYTAPQVGAVPLPITVRWHTNSVRHGDLDREGYAQQNEDINRMIFLADQVVPARNGVVVLDGQSYAVDFVLPYEGSFIPCDMAKIRA